jgi:Chaperone of endosialidase
MHCFPLPRLNRAGIAAALALILFTPETVMAQANTAYGENTLLSNTGNDNSAFGYGALQFNVGGFRNTGLGQGALYSNVSGYQNTATGSLALVLNTNGAENTANGVGALYQNTEGSANTAIGSHALEFNQTGIDNTAAGFQALYNNNGYSNTASGSGSLFSMNNGWGNTATGYQALYSNVYGHNNVAVGHLAGLYLTGSNNIDIGNQGTSSDNNTIRIGAAQNRTFISGISGRTASGGVQVYINSSGQLGTLTSSERFKQDINSVDAVSGKLLQLRPVSFRYNEAAENGDRPLQYGLIAEEVAKVYPELVQYDQEGKPFTVYYHLLTPLLLAELQKGHALNDAQQAQLTDIRALADRQQADLETQRVQLASQREELLALLKQQQQQHVAEMTALQNRLSQLDAMGSTARVASTTGR